MTSERAVGVAPLLTGLLLASQSGQAIVQSGPSLWSVPGLVGGCAAVAVGAGILSGWDAFEVGTGDGNRSVGVALAALALLSFVAGAGLAVV